MPKAIGVMLFGLLAVTGWAQVGGDGNEFPSQAVDLGVLPATTDTLAITDALDYRGDIDWFTFQVEVACPVAISVLMGTEVGVRFVLFDANLGYLADGGADTISILTLDSGSYYLRIDSPNLEVGAYNIAVSNRIESETNDGVGFANPLGTFVGQPLSIYASISPTGDLDCFRFEVPPEVCEDGLLQITTSGTGRGDTFMVLYRQDEVPDRFLPIASNDDYVDYWSGIVLYPEPGVYVVRIAEFGENDTIEIYTLTVDCLQPVSFGSMSGGETLAASGYINPGEKDFFTFELTEEAQVIIEVTGPGEGDSYLSLYDEAGNLIAENDDRPEDLWSRISETLEPGRYIVVVESFWADEEFEYVLDILAFRAVAEVESNDDLLTPQDLEAPPVLVVAHISPGDQDYYRFQLETPAQLVIETSGEDGDTYICLYDESYTELECDDDGGEGLWSRIDINVSSGIYYVMVEGYSSTDEFDYYLSILIP